MANTQIFRSYRGAALPRTDAINAERAPAYGLSPKHALAQLAATGCVGTTFYADAQTQVDRVLELAGAVEPEFVAKAAVYCRERGYMKDMPSLLAAALTMRGTEYLPRVFERVIDNGRMLRNFVQIVRSGAVGRKSLGTRAKRLVQRWLNGASEKALLSASVGSAPSLSDVVKMVHPKPGDAWREAFFARLIGKPFELQALPPVTRAYETYKRAPGLDLPDVPFQMLTALQLDTAAWTRIALQANWQMVRMNLNTFARHGVFEVEGAAERIAEKLSDRVAIAKARAFPYQLLAAYTAASGKVPGVVSEALQDALAIALENVPALAGSVVVCPDVSGSMRSPVSGYRRGATTAVRCIDVAALTAAAILRQNRKARVLPFEQQVVAVALNPRDAVMTNAAKLAAIGGGGTNCSAPLEKLNQEQAKADLVVFISDNQSWVDAQSGGTAMMQQWATLKQRNPSARLVCIDVQPYATTQAKERDDILNIGGFSDDVFRILAAFASGQLNAQHWVGVIEAVEL